MPKVSAEYREAKRRRVLDAAVDCFSTRGFAWTSMQDIFEASGMTAGAVYGYFAGKDEIVAAIAAERHEQEAELMAAALRASDLREGLHVLTRSYFEWLRDPDEQRRRRVGVQMWAESLTDDRLAASVTQGRAAREALAKAITSAKRKGLVRKDVDSAATARLMLAVLQGFLLQLAWEPDVDVGRFLAVVDPLIDDLFEPGA